MIKKQRWILFFESSRSASQPQNKLSHSNSSSGTAADVLQALAFVPVTVYVFGWCTAAGGDRTTAVISRPMQQSKTHRRTSYQVYEADSRIKNQ